ncbi:MAG TPA: efflux RND transporter permease subunit, partial [bacterium]|nr:efflux RND transporter permease subunit [bacterium]
VRAADAVKKELTEIEGQLPSDMKIGISMDFSPMIKESIQTVKDNAYQGAFLAAVVLLLFLRSWRSMLIILIAIPTSVVSTFFCMYLADMTLNLISLGGLALGVGMVIDNSIVVIENIFRHRKNNPDQHPHDVAGNAASELALALTASTFTTVAVFFPIVFVEGIAGEVFKDLALVIVFSILASLLVALTVVPCLGARLIARGDKPKSTVRAYVALCNSFDRLMAWAPASFSAYGSGIKSVSRSTATRILTVLAAGVFSVAVFKYMQPSQAQFPKMDQGMINVELEMPQGSNLKHTDQAALRLEKICMEVPEAQIVSSTVRGNKASVFISLGNVEDRERSLWDVMDELRALSKDFAEGEVRVQEMSHGGGGEDKPVQIEIIGSNYTQIQNFARQIKARLQNVPGVWDVETSFEKGKPEIQIIIDRKRAADLGLSARTIAETIETYMTGTVAGQFRVEGEEFDIRVRLQKE